MDELTSEELKAYISGLRERLNKRRVALSQLTEEVQRGERELQLWLEIARLRGVAAEEGEPGMHPSVAAEIDHGTVLGVHSLEGGVVGLTETVVAILRDSGKPMHIQELMKAVRDRGGQIPGKGEPANLIARIRKFPGIVRPVRGMYGLREWGLLDKPTQPRRSPRRAARKASSASSSEARTGGSRPSRRTR